MCGIISSTPIQLFRGNSFLGPWNNNTAASLYGCLGTFDLREVVFGFFVIPSFVGMDADHGAPQSRRRSIFGARPQYLTASTSVVGSTLRTEVEDISGRQLLCERLECLTQSSNIRPIERFEYR